MLPILFPIIKGFLVTMGLIAAIGVQNSFILRQGIIGKYLLFTVTICVLLDILLISIGVYGIGYTISKIPIFMSIVKWGGFAFLSIYGLLSFKHVFDKESLDIGKIKNNQSLTKLFLTLLAISLLNPHVYLDTVLLIGTVGSQYDNEGKILFIIGSGLASTTWFLGLCYGAKHFSHILQRPKIWKMINAITGIIMFIIAFSLIGNLSV